MHDSEELKHATPEVRPRGLIALRRRGIDLLPHLFTTAALFSGFYAIVQAMNGRFEHGAGAIFVAMVLDGLDGRVARSTFGAQYDSLTDMVAFGAAPALAMYEWALKDLGRVGWIAAFVYCAGAALRLARFNVNVDVADKRYFQGIPSPAAAALLAGMILASEDLGLDRESWRNVVAWVVTVYAGITMVANVPFYSFRELDLNRAVPFSVALLLVGGLAVASPRPAVVLFLACLAFSVSGYVLWGMGVRVRPSADVP